MRWDWWYDTEYRKPIIDIRRLMRLMLFKRKTGWHRVILLGLSGFICVLLLIVIIVPISATFRLNNRFNVININIIDIIFLVIVVIVPIMAQCYWQRNSANDGTCYHLSNEMFTCLSHVFVCLFCLYWISLWRPCLYINIRMEFSGDKAEEGNLKTVRILL